MKCATSCTGRVRCRHIRNIDTGVIVMHHKHVCTWGSVRQCVSASVRHPLHREHRPLSPPSAPQAEDLTLASACHALPLCAALRRFACKCSPALQGKSLLPLKSSQQADSSHRASSRHVLVARPGPQLVQVRRRGGSRLGARSRPASRRPRPRGFSWDGCC